MVAAGAAVGVGLGCRTRRTPLARAADAPLVRAPAVDDDHDADQGQHRDQAAGDEGPVAVRLAPAGRLGRRQPLGPGGPAAGASLGRTASASADAGPPWAAPPASDGGRPAWPAGLWLGRLAGGLADGLLGRCGPLAGRRLATGRASRRPGLDAAVGWRRGCLAGGGRSAGLAGGRAGAAGAGTWPRRRLPVPLGWSCAWAAAVAGPALRPLLLGGHRRAKYPRRLPTCGHAGPEGPGAVVHPRPTSTAASRSPTRGPTARPSWPSSRSRCPVCQMVAPMVEPWPTGGAGWSPSARTRPRRLAGYREPQGQQVPTLSEPPPYRVSGAYGLASGADHLPGRRRRRRPATPSPAGTATAGTGWPSAAGGRAAVGARRRPAPLPPRLRQPQPPLTRSGQLERCRGSGRPPAAVAARQGRRARPPGRGRARRDGHHDHQEDHGAGRRSPSAGRSGRRAPPGPPPRSGRRCPGPPCTGSGSGPGGRSAPAAARPCPGPTARRRRRRPPPPGRRWPPAASGDTA